LFNSKSEAFTVSFFASLNFVAGGLAAHLLSKSLVRSARHELVEPQFSHLKINTCCYSIPFYRNFFAFSRTAQTTLEQGIHKFM
jgi:hypothetical protein